MISISISLTHEQYKMLNVLKSIPGSAPKAVARAINRAVEGARTDTIKEICLEYVVKPVAIRKTIHIIRARPGNLKAQIISTGKPLPLMNFYVKPKVPPTQLGIKVSARKLIESQIKTGSKKLWSHAFVARMHTESSITGERHVGVFYRTGRFFGKKEKGGIRRPTSHYHSRDSRTEIKAIYSLSVPQMISNDDVLESIERKARERLDKELRHQITYLLGGGK